ncbi:cell division protein FtsL [Roseomonas sp. WA12]
MIRPLTFLSLVAAAGAGLHLYGVKHEVSQLERTLRDTVKQTDAARERTSVLRAEWALLNEPERLRAAAARNLPLDVMQTAQFVRPAELERRLPAAVAFAGAPSLFAPTPADRLGTGVGTAVAAAMPAVSATAPAANSPSANNLVTAAASAPAPASAAARLAQAVPASPAPTASVSVVPLPPAAPRAVAPAQLAAVVPARPAPVAERPTPERVVAERVAPERITTERPAPLRVAPPHLPQLAGARIPEPRAAEPASRLAEATRPALPRFPAPVPAGSSSTARPAETRLVERLPDRSAEREVDRGMNLSAPPLPAALLRTALHMRPTAPAVAAPAPRAPDMPAGTGSMLGAAARPMLAPPVPMASANAATLGSLR